MKQFFAYKKDKDILYLNKDELNHIKNVLRMKKGEKIEVVCLDKKYEAILNEDYLSCKIIKEINEEYKKSLKKIFYIPVLVEDKMSFIFQKGTELGIDEFVPISFERCKVKITEKNEIKKLDRWRKIVENASMQCKRKSIPMINKIYKVKDIIPSSDVNIVCSLDNTNVKSFKEMLTNLNSYATISVLFGPEGGLTKEEEIILTDKGFVKTRLCNNVLRTETVILYTGSIIDFLYEGE